MISNTPLQYHLSFSEPQSHLVDVTLTLPGVDPATEVEVWMPVWTPGSYLVREYSRHVQELTARDTAGKTLDIRKIRKNRWVITPSNSGPITVSYRVYGREMSVRTNWIDDRFAFLAGAATFLTVDGRENHPHAVTVEIPPHWGGVWTSLEITDTDSPNGPYVAADLDELIDSPILAGNPARYDFSVEGIPITLLNEGEGGLWDGAKAAGDVKAIVEEYGKMYGSLPFDRYLFMNLIVEARGGLEHKKSCVMMTSRYSFSQRRPYIDWLGLVSHEFFHVWNVKRSRPEALGPFDYENEVYSRALWVAEGITAYYTDLIPARAGLTTESEYLGKFSNLIEILQTTPGRRHQSLEQSSFDAWIKLYRADENTRNTTVSYYTKGAVVTWLLDTEIRTVTDGEKTLDDVMRLLFAGYSGEQGFSDADMQRVCEEIAGKPLDAFFDAYIRGKQELDYEPVLRYWGLQFDDPYKSTSPTAVWLGIETTARDGKLLVQAVRDDGPARRAGLNVDDEILALGGYRVDPQTFKDRLAQYQPEQRIEILVARRDAVRIVPVTFEKSPGSPWRLIPDPAVPEAAQARRKAWLTGASR